MTHTVKTRIESSIQHYMPHIFLRTLDFLKNVPGRLLVFGKFASKEVLILSFFQINTKIGHTLRIDYCTRISSVVFCKEITLPCDNLVNFGSYFQEKFPPRTFIRDRRVVSLAVIGKSKLFGFDIMDQNLIHFK